VRLRTSLLALLLIAARAELARAGDPAADARSVLASLPVPSAGGAWEFQGYVLRHGRPYGRVSLSARPHPEEEGRWLARDEITPLAAEDFAVLQTAVLDRQLLARSGRSHRRNTRGFLRSAFTWHDDGYALEHEADYYENHLDVPGPPGLASLAGLVTFLRFAPAEAAIYTLRDFDPDPAAGDGYAAPAHIQVHGTAPWRVSGGVREAWIASVTRGKQTLRLAFDPASRALLGVEYVGLGVQLVPEGSGAVGLADPGAQAFATPLERAVERTARVRRALAEPARPLSFLGEIRLDGTRVGSVMLAAEPTSVDGAPAWRVLESETIHVGAARIESEVTGFLGADLGVMRGEQIDKRPEGSFHVTYARKPGGIETIAHTAKGPEAAVLLDAPEGALTGLVPVLLFLRDVPAEPAEYVLPGWDPRYAQSPKAGTGTFTLSRSDLHVTVTMEKHPLRLEARCERRNGEVFDVAVRARDRLLLGVRGVMPRLSYVLPGTQPAALDWYDAVEGKPTTWRQAFVKFGRGYHLPRRDLLADAFHWPSMVEHAVQTKRYEAGTPESKIRDDWIDVFVGMSKHRTEGDCDDLLFQIFMTSEAIAHEDGSVSLRTIPAYGGHTYRMREIDDRWWIVQVD